MANKEALRDAVFKAVEAYCAADFGYSFDPKNPIVRLHEPTFSAGEINAALECLLSTYVTMGPKVKKFEEVDRQHPYSEWARKSLIMQAFAHYQAGQYEECVIASKRCSAMVTGADVSAVFSGSAFP